MQHICRRLHWAVIIGVVPTAETKPRIRYRHVSREVAERRAPSTLRDWLRRVDDRFMGTPLDVHPHDAILHAMRLSAGEVAYCDAQVRRLSEDELFEVPITQTWAEMPSGRMELIEEKRTSEVISRWVKLRDNAADRMARYAEMAIRVGVEERKIKLAEREANLVAQYFERVLGELDLTPEQFSKAGPAMRRHLELLEGVAA